MGEDGTAMDVFMKCVGWRSSTVPSIFIEVTQSTAASRGTTRLRDTAFIEADALPLSEGFVGSYASFPRGNQRKKNA